MPRGDGTGPRGMGMMSGKAMGFCAGTGVPGFAMMDRMFFGNPGRGVGRRWLQTGNGVGSAPVQPDFPEPQEEKNILQSRLSVLEKELENLKQRLAQIS